MANNPPPIQQQPYAAPQAELQQMHGQGNGHGQEQGDSTGGVIPYKNPPALISYYLGIVGLFPIIGVPIGIAAIVLGFKGLKKHKENPIVAGKVHAIIGISLGFLQFLWNIPIVLAIIAVLVAAPNF